MVEFWKSERDFVTQYLFPEFKKAAEKEAPGLVDLHVDARVDGGIADLYAETSGKRIFVVEAKFKKKSGKIERDIEPRDPDVINQAVNYAVHGGFPYYLTCNVKRIVLFQLQPGKRPIESEIASFEFEKGNWAEEILKITLGKVSVGLKPLDDTLVDILREAFNDLYPEFLDSLKQKLKDGAFRKKYEEWLEDQGLRMDDETNRLIAEQSCYLQLNKMLFYNTIRTIYPDRLDELKIGEEEDVMEALSRFYEKARKIDYAPVYESDIISEIPLTVRAKLRFRTLIDTLREFDFSSMKSDFLGRVYEKLIPPGERKRLGQFYTPPDIVKLITSLTIKGPDVKVLDPACGSGSFLVEAYNRLGKLKGYDKGGGPLAADHHRELLSQVYGVDINQFPAHLSVINLTIQNPSVAVDKVNVAVADFFDVYSGQRVLIGFDSITSEGGKSEIELPSVFDVVVSNPPYIRQELLGKEEKTKIKKTIGSDIERIYFGGASGKHDKDAIVLDKQSDIYIYFFIHGWSFLRNGGRLGFISSNKWLEVDYGKPFQEFLLKHAKINYVIEFDRAVFPDAEVNTCITILEKEKDQKAREENSVRFVRLKQKLTIDETVRILEMVEDSYEDEKVRVNVVKQRSLRPGKWNVYLRAPPVYQKIVSHPKMRPLADIAQVFRGVTTGYNDYFILDEDRVKEWGIEKEFLVPCVSSPKKVKGLIIKPEDVKEYFFMVAEDQVVPKNSNAYRYIKYGENLEVEVTRGSQKGKRKLPELETVKGRKKWFCLPRFNTPEILFPRLSDVKVKAFYNEAKCQAAHLFSYIIPPTNGRVIAAVLNSSIGSFLAELYGRSYGGGVLDVETYELKLIPVLNPQRLSDFEIAALESAFNTLAKAVDEKVKAEDRYEEVRSKSDDGKGILEEQAERVLKQARKKEQEAQKALDNVVYDILGLSQKERNQVEDGLRELQEIRMKRKQA